MKITNQSNSLQKEMLNVFIAVNKIYLNLRQVGFVSNCSCDFDAGIIM